MLIMSIANLAAKTSLDAYVLSCYVLFKLYALTNRQLHPFPLF
jgi:hypothetical protein